MNKRQKQVLALLAVVALLAAAFWYGGGAPGLQGWSVGASTSAAQGDNRSAPSASDQQGSASTSQLPSTSQENNPVLPPPAKPEDTSPDQPSSSSGSDSASSQPSQQQGDGGTSSPEAQVLSCTLSIRCDSILDNLDWLAPDKVELIPADGVILATCSVTFEAGESVFSLLQKQSRQAGIHMEASYTPGTGSAYLEGIANLYEFDCGQGSGWLYLVNGISPGYSASEYPLADGDQVEWIYTCDLGQDAGVAQ